MNHFRHLSPPAPRPLHGLCLESLPDPFQTFFSYTFITDDPSVLNMLEKMVGVLLKSAVRSRFVVPVRR